MGSARNVVEQAYAAMRDGDVNALLKLCSSDCELVDMGMTMRGPDQIGAYLQAFVTAFPDINVQVRQLLEDGDAVAAEVRFTGTQTGALAMPTGELPASGRSIDLEAVDLFRTQDGQIKAWRVYMDSTRFMTQLGLMPEPAQATPA